MPEIVNPEKIKFTFYRVQIVIRCIWPTGVADTRWLSRSPDPDFPHPGSRIQKQQQVSIVVNYFIFEQVQKKSSQFTKNFCTFPGSATLGQTNFRLAYLCDRMREIRMVSRFWYRMFQMNPYFRLGRCKFAARHRPLPTLNNLPSPARTIYPLNNWIFFPASKYTVITKN